MEECYEKSRWYLRLGFPGQVIKPYYGFTSMEEKKLFLLIVFTFFFFPSNPEKY